MEEEVPGFSALVSTPGADPFPAAPDPDPIGHAFADAGLLRTALTHASLGNERGLPHNERLEFLGDAVLQLCATELLFVRFPEVREDALTTFRQRLVNEENLASIGLLLGLGGRLALSRGEEETGGRERASNVASAVEAVLGAIYLDGGLAAAQAACMRWLSPRIEAFGDPRAAAEAEKSPIALLQELTQAKWGCIPVYEELSKSGPDHAPHYHFEVFVNGVCVGAGAGSRKRRAKETAAREALTCLRRREAEAG